MSKEYFNEVDKFLTERFKNHERLKRKGVTVHAKDWVLFANEYTEYSLRFNSFENLCLRLENIEIHQELVFIIQVPDSIEKLKTVLDIIDPC